MDARLVASRLPGIAMYGQPFNAPPFPGYLPYGPADASAFYSPLQAGENAEAWRAGLTQAAAAYYDPALAAHYGYGYGPMGLSDGARRKNATRETTSTLKAWLNEHRKNPYPTKGEKIMLAIITKMTLTQVSTWFANARRRLKKENKMTWSPRNRCGDEDDDDMDRDDDSNLNNNSNNPVREGSNHESGGSRCSSPVPSSAPSDGPNRTSSFDLPHSARPFLPRPELTGSFGARPNGLSVSDHHSEDGSRKRSQGDEDEEIDLESVEEDRKESAFVKRTTSSDSHSHNDSGASSQRRESSTTSPTQAGPQHSIPGLFQNVPHHPAFHPAVSNPALNPAAAASMLARHHLQPHPQHRLHPALGHQPSGFGPVPTKLPVRRGSTSPTHHPYARNAASSPTSSVASGSSAISSPSKPKIWSLADVATSNEGPKSSKHGEPTSTNAPNSSMSTSPTPGMAVFAGRGPAIPQGNPQHHQSPLNPEAHATIRNWMDGVMQQKMAAAAAAAAAMSGGQGHPPFFPGGLLPQHLAAALNPAALAVAASLPRGTDAARFQPPFPGFAELAAAQRAQMAAHVADMQAHHHAPGMMSSSSVPTLPTDSGKATAAPRSRILSHPEDKAQSPMSTSASPEHSMPQTSEVSGFLQMNSRPDSSDSGIASAETSKDNLTQGSEPTMAK